MNELTPQTAQDKKPKRLNPKQKRTIESYFEPTSDTYANLYQSALKAGFRPTYALNLANRKPLWLSETVESTKELTSKHILKGIENIATKDNINSRSPDDTRLAALTQLGKWSGLDKATSTTVIVQPILGGASTKPIHVDVEYSREQPKKEETS